MKKRLLLSSALMVALGMQAQVPKADLLDVVFQPDGTAIDVSASQRVINQTGTPVVKQSTQLGVPVLCNGSTTWASAPENYFTVDVTDEMWASLADGHSFECLARPYWDGGLQSNWGTMMGLQQTGGVGLLLTEGKWAYEPHIGGDYHTITWDGTPERSAWVHLVGVWDAAAGQVRLYMNGELASSKDVEGELDRPNAEGTPWMGIGCDYIGKAEGAEHAFQGDIALVRIYNDALTDEQAATLWQQAKAMDTGQAEHKEETEFSDLRYNEEGTILVATAEELYKAALLSQQNATMNVMLEADIDYSEYNQVFTVYPRTYNGFFDGQGHTITVNLNLENWTSGFIADLGKGSEVRNLTLKGTVTTSQQWTSPLLGMNAGGTVKNVTVEVEMTTYYSGDTYCGGFSSWDGTGSRYENCISKCVMSAPNGGTMAGFTADVAGDTHFVNCLALCQMSAADATWCSEFVGWVSGGTAYTDNVYYINPAEMPCRYGNCTLVTEEQLASGEICVRLNKGAVSQQAVWHQTLGTDNAPTLDPTHGVVIGAGTEYMCINDESDIPGVAAEYTQLKRDEIGDPLAYTTLVDEVATALDQLENVNTWSELETAYETVQTLLDRLAKNIQAYVELQEAATRVYAQLSEMSGTYVESMLSFFEDAIEPCEDYPLGTYPYVTENYSLDTEDVLAMTETINEMEKKAMAIDAAAGADVTVLLENADFANGFQGWKGQVMNGYGTNGNMNAAENWGGRAFDMYQTITGLKNGVYRLQVKGGYRPFDNAYANQYYPTIYANDQMNYLQDVIEDMISADDAVDLENCWIGADAAVRDKEILDTDGTLLGYALHGIQSCCYAFQAGRYPNSILVDVQDGQLTVGIRHPYSGYGGDEWVGIGDIQLTYEGTLEEAGEAISQTLASVVARAKHIQQYEFSNGEDYAWYPNFSQALKDRLNEAIQAAEAEGTDAAAQYALIQTFSQLFGEIINSKRLYTDMARSLIGYADRVIDYPGHALELEEACALVWDDWTLGVFNTKEEMDNSLATLDALFSSMLLELPQADLLDLVFNAEEGTVVDQSPMQNPVEASADMKVVTSPKLGMDVMCLAENEWATNNSVSYAKVPVSDELWNGMADGLTVECYLRPTWEGEEMPGNWASCLGMEDAGGLGMIMYNGHWMFEVCVDGSYRDAVYNAPVVKDEWIHLIGVWNQADGIINLYVNGEFAGSTSGNGSLTYPLTNPCWIGVGGDLADRDVPEATLQGDIAIFRIYDQPVNGSQAAAMWRNVKAMDTGKEEHSEDGTGISSIMAGQQQPEGIYNMMGQKLARPVRGINIIGGKKVYIRK